MFELDYVHHLDYAVNNSQETLLIYKISTLMIFLHTAMSIVVINLIFLSPTSCVTPSLIYNYIARLKDLL